MKPLRNLMLGATLSVCMASVGCGPQGGSSGPAGFSTEQLPVERFDLYPAGSLPPYPWQPVGKFSDLVRMDLRPEGESRFIANAVTGKGLVMEDRDPTAGAGCGIAYTFAPPPPGPQYLGFDFRNTAGSTLDWECRLDDSAGKGLRLHIAPGGELLAGAIGGALTRVALIKADTWYHVAVRISGAGEATVALTESTKPEGAAGSATIALSEKDLAFTRLSFRNIGSQEQTGGWALDNVLMAGRVDAPRDALLPFKQPPLSELRSSPRKVYAYYYEIYPSGYSDRDPGLAPYTKKLFNPSLTPADRVKSGTELLYRPLPRPPMEPGLSADEVLIRAMEEEVRLGIQMGLDGFLLDFFALPESYPDVGNIREYNRRSFALMDAAARVDPGFRIIPAIYAGPKPPPGLPPDQDVEAAWTAAYADSPIVRKILAHPQVLRTEDGRVYLSKWGTEMYPAAWWQRVVDRLAAGGIPVAFLGQFNGLSTARLQTYSALCYAMADWGPRTPKDYRWVEKARPLTTKVVSPVAFQDVRTRERVYWEAWGSEAFRNMWQSAIRDGADWVFITTWSDYSEQAQAPSTAIGFALYDLNAYYIQWFKLGAPPVIDRDVLYYFHRIQHTDTASLRGEPWKLIPEGNMTTRNDIELLAFLKEPGELRIQAGDETRSEMAGAGITSLKAPIPPGEAFTPVFSLLRNGHPVLQGRSRYAILDRLEYPNLLYHAGVLTNEAPPWIPHNP